MIIGFTGHRDKICDVQSLLRIEEQYPGATWVHGGAPGFDSHVHQVALSIGKVAGETLIVVRPDYKQYVPRVAPIMRNRVIVDMAEKMIACYDGRLEGGTVYTINYAIDQGKPPDFVTPLNLPKN